MERVIVCSNKCKKITNVYPLNPRKNKNSLQFTKIYITLCLCLVTMPVIDVATVCLSLTQKPSQSTNVTLSVCVTHSAESLGEKRIWKVEAASNHPSAQRPVSKNSAPLVLHSATLSSR